MKLILLKYLYSIIIVNSIVLHKRGRIKLAY